MRWLFTLLFLGCVCSRAAGTLQDALLARQLLADFTRALVVRLDLTPEANGPTRSLYSLAFAFDGVFWIYVPESGSFALGAIAPGVQPDLDLLNERLRVVEPRIEAAAIDRRDHVPSSSRTLGNGCFVGCLANLLALLERGESIRAAGIVFLSHPPDPAHPDVSPLLANQGHALLVYHVDRYWFALDPNHPNSRIDLDVIQSDNPVDAALLRYASGNNYPTGRARYLAISAATLKHLADDVVWQRRLAHRSDISPN
jgi:hypothetical protein